MSYLVFHLVLVLPPIVLMAATLPASLDEFGGWRGRMALPLIAGIALSYTTAWDNYLVAREVWWYGPNRVLATIGFVPVEEYLFFILQPILTGLFLFQYLGRQNDPVPPAGPESAWTGFLAFTAVSVAGALLLASGPKGLYMGLVLTWAGPLLAGMWLYDGETLWGHRRTLLYAVGVPTVYLWGADAIAIATGIWTISGTYTLGLSVGSLPVEEATFFLMTNLLVVKGILLLIYGSHEALGRSIRRR
ncbi:MAG: lycopene cyclase domain-containing protein [Salinibacter sp.]